MPKPVIPTNALAAPVIPTEPSGEWRNLVFALVKQGKTDFFKSSQTSRERGNQRFRCVGFPSPYLFTRNSWTLPIYLPETHGEFRATPKNAVHFLYGAALHRPALLRLKTPVLGTAMSKSSRIRHSPNSGTVRRFPPWNVFPP